ncbi:sulfatase-like hydrolase/transferase [Lujinxingia vulgaris]|uniref:Sulfatase-like hydrolase/transferase n=1 Tax=Lujinxingia vulgaris TaxID=2600176 RepID=A0A5C6XNL2_9DELT|nr:sulfatase-like hydrolase/transferase [Lujinxingia vulgaris]TXD40684.1 sulfatase-like hydrolase/transferase [Lujinxingia vulgaris]
MRTDTSRVAFLSLLLAGVIALSVETLALTLSEPTVALWMLPTHVGVVGPLVLLGAALGVVVARSWGGLWSERKPEALNVVAWLVSAPVLLGAWLAITTLISLKLDGRIATPWMGALLGALLSACAGAAILAMSSPGVLLVRRLIARVTKHPVGRFVLRAELWVPALLVCGALVALIMPLIGPGALKVLPWSYVATGCAGLAALPLSWKLLNARPELKTPLMRALPASLVLLSLFSPLMPRAMERARSSFSDKPAVASHLYSALAGPLDFDGDGALSLYAGGDCAPFDAARGPHQVETPNDGIDQNCSGADLTYDVADFGPGPKRVAPPEGISRRPNIILVTTDALSFKHTTAGGYERDTTPNLAAWAERATVFETAFSNSTSTRLSMPGLVTSKMNSMVRMTNRRVHPYPYATDEVTLGTMLRDAGYRTVHIPGDRYFVRWRGYALGFEEFDTQTYKKADDRGHTSPALTERAIEIIEQHDDERPLALWIHYYDHHGPYDIPEGARVFGEGKSNMERFESELWFADQSWKNLFEAVEARWEPEDYVMVFTSDHGEAFDKNHPREHHDFSVYTRPTHIPLIIQAPFGRGERIDGLTGHIDVLPTLANLLDLEPQEDWLGETLVPALVEGQSPQKDVMHSLFYIPEAAKRGEETFKMIGTRTDDLYYFDDRIHGVRRLVRWREDPIDAVDVSGEEPETAEIFRYITGQRLQWLREREEALTAYAPDAEKADEE